MPIITHCAFAELYDVVRILRKHGYPPDLQTAAAQLVLQQAEQLCEAWV